MPSRVPLIYGSAAFGEPGKHVARLHTLPECQAVVDMFVGRGYQILDCARGYGRGTSEEFLGKLDLKGARVDTKLAPMAPGAFAPDKLREQMQESLKALGPHKIRVLYLHAPDRSVPYEDTLRQINEFHKEGMFEEFGLSNFRSYDKSHVAEFVMLAKANGWIQPTVYQGVYNAVERMIEPELIPCLRKFGIRYYAYSPLASGLLVGNLFTEADLAAARGSRWDPTNAGRLADMLKGKYKPLLPLLKPLKEALEKHNVTMAEAAQRWLQHHSALGPEDGVVIGASNLKQLETNLDNCEGGPLPQDILDVLDEAWEKAKGQAGTYA